MNIKSSTVSNANSAQNTSQKSNTQSPSAKFSDELKSLKKTSESKDSKAAKEEKEDKSVDDAVNGLNSAVKEMKDKDINQLDEKNDKSTNPNEDFADNNNMINNDMNIQDKNDLLQQMSANMSFSGNGQAFSSFMNNGNTQNQQLSSSAQDLAEESAILSTMAENIAMASKAAVKGNSTLQVVTNSAENTANLSDIAMNEADVEVFTTLIQNGEANLNNLSPSAAQKSVHVSKTLADMLAKSMKNNQPLRINFDNNISVIIRVSRDGKISADFLPSSQVAEAYLKENLPLLRQKFEQNDIDYNELNHRERREQDREDNRKKGQENE